MLAFYHTNFLPYFTYFRKMSNKTLRWTAYFFNISTLIYKLQISAWNYSDIFIGCVCYYALIMRYNIYFYRHVLPFLSFYTHFTQPLILLGETVYLPFTHNFCITICKEAMNFFSSLFLKIINLKIFLLQSWRVSKKSFRL